MRHFVRFARSAAPMWTCSAGSPAPMQSPWWTTVIQMRMLFPPNSMRSGWTRTARAPYRRRLAPDSFRQRCAWVAQLVEQRIENPRVTGSIPVPGTTSTSQISRFSDFCGSGGVAPRDSLPLRPGPRRDGFWRQMSRTACWMHVEDCWTNLAGSTNPRRVKRIHLKELLLEDLRCDGRIPLTQWGGVAKGSRTAILKRR